MRTNRLLEIEDYIISNRSVSMDKLCEIFNVSKNTIRRDLNELTRNGLIKKVYGGVAVNENYQLVPFEERNIKNINLKSTIGKLSSQLINDGDIIFLDSGTTSLAIIDYLKNKQNLTILTNNLEAIIKSINYPNLNIIVLAGNLIRETSSFVGMDTISILEKYNINKCFMTSTGISIENGITNSYLLESEIKKFAMQKGLTVYLLVDSSKFDICTLVTYGRLESIDYLITDKLPTHKYISFCNENNIILVTPDSL